MAENPDTYINWGMYGPFLCSESGWRADSNRIYMTHYSFFLQVRDTNAFLWPGWFNRTEWWRDIYEVDFGEPDGSAYEVSSTGSGYTKLAVMRRDYNGGGTVIILRTGHGSADYVNDSVAVNLNEFYYEIDANADTSAAANSIFYLKPYMAKILITADSCGAAPVVPQPASPAQGSSVGNTPTLCVTNSDHGICVDPVTYQFEISQSANFSQIDRQSGWIAEGSGTTCFTTSAPLDNGRRYYWRCRANNGTAISGWSQPSNFGTPNTAPPAPTGASPTDQGNVDNLRPYLAVNNVTDPDGTPVVYFFEVSKFSNFSALATQSGPVAAGSQTSSWQVGTSLENGSSYFWRTRAYDNLEYSGWMTTMSFTVDASATNSPPTTPAIYSPPDSATVTIVPVSLLWYNSTDPDGDNLTYNIELYDSSSGEYLDSTSGISQGPGATTAYEIPANLTNAAWYNWRVRASDGLDYSAWMNMAAFYFDTLSGMNQPPEPPGLVSPLNNDTLISLQVTLEVSPAFDPESSPLTYEFELYNDEQATHLIDNEGNIPDLGAGDNISWSISIPLASGAQYAWRSRAFDGVNYSSWTPLYNFWVFDFSVNADETPPTNLSPLMNALVSQTRPTLEVTNVITGLPGNIYYFEVSEDSTFVSRVFSGPIEEDNSGTTSWEVSEPLKSGRTYFWRSRANNSPYSDMSAFTVDANVYMAPNPFQPHAGHVQATVFNMAPSGILTITTITNDVVVMLDGNSSGVVTWDVTNNNGEKLASDVYLCYYRDNDKVDRFKFVVIR
jgi:hypothetical protein